MASEHTQNYNLSRWTLADEVRMEDFNSDNEKIDAAIATRGNCRIIQGSYVGTGKAGSSNPVQLDFEDTLGQAPLLLFVHGGSSSLLVLVRGQRHSIIDPGEGSATVSATWTQTGVSWYEGYNAWAQMNTAGTEYHYVALC